MSTAELPYCIWFGHILHVAMKSTLGLSQSIVSVIMSWKRDGKIKYRITFNFVPMLRGLYFELFTKYRISAQWAVSTAIVARNRPFLPPVQIVNRICIAACRSTFVIYGLRGFTLKFLDFSWPWKQFHVHGHLDL